MITTRSRGAVAALTLGLLVGAVPPAGASGGDDDIRRSGQCTNRSDWKLKAKPDDGLLQVEGEVDTPRVGRLWRWKILHDGEVAHTGLRRTTARSGSFSVERRVTNRRGVDVIGWRAFNRATGEHCRGWLRI